MQSINGSSCKASLESVVNGRKVSLCARPVAAELAAILLGFVEDTAEKARQIVLIRRDVSRLYPTCALPTPHALSSAVALW